MGGTDNLPVDNPVAEPAAIAAEAGAVENQPTFDPVTATGSERLSYLTSLLNGTPAAPESGASGIAPEEPVATGPATPPEPTEPPAEPWIEQIPDKFKKDGKPDYEALSKSYLYAEKKLSEQGSVISQINDLQQVVLGLQQQIMAGNVPTTSDPATGGNQPPEQQEIDPEEFLEQFYKNPQEALQKILEPVINPVIKPLQEQMEYNQELERWTAEVERCKQAHQGDFDLLRPKMQEIIRTRGQYLRNMPDGMEVAYQLAKAEHLAANPPAPKEPEPRSIDTLMQDATFLEKITQHPDVQKMVLTQYAAGVKETPKPIVMGNRAGSEMPATPAMEIKSTKDAAKASVAFFQRFFNGGS